MNQYSQGRRKHNWEDCFPFLFPNLISFWSRAKHEVFNIVDSRDTKASAYMCGGHYSMTCHRDVWTCLNCFRLQNVFLQPWETYKGEMILGKIWGRPACVMCNVRVSSCTLFISIKLTSVEIQMYVLCTGVMNQPHCYWTVMGVGTLLMSKCFNKSCCGPSKRLLFSWDFDSFTAHPTMMV